MPRSTQTHHRPLAVCATCGLEFIAVDQVLEVTDEGEWTLRVSCRSCAWAGTVVADDDAIDELTLAHETAEAAIRDTADAMAADAFAAALAGDRILPEDF